MLWLDLLCFRSPTSDIAQDGGDIFNISEEGPVFFVTVGTMGPQSHGKFTLTDSPLQTAGIELRSLEVLETESRLRSNLPCF